MTTTAMRASAICSGGNHVIIIAADVPEDSR
jgi:hypothetical protein